MPKYGIYGYRDELREKRKKRKIRIAFLVVSSSVAFIVFTAYALFFSGWFLVKAVQISGNNEISEAEIKKIVSSHLDKSYLMGYIKPFSNIFFTDSDELEDSLKEIFPLINTAEVNKKFFKRNLSVEIGEREAAGIWCQSGGDRCFYFDKDRVLFKESPRFSGQVFLAIEDGRDRNFNLSDVFDDEELLGKINLAKGILDELKIVNYSSFFLPQGSFEFWIKTKEGWYIYMDKETDIPTQLVALKKFLDEKISASRRRTLEYIDLRVNNRIYYK